MSSSSDSGSVGIYGRYWDYYVRRWEDLQKREGHERPGDEWGTPSGWEWMFDRLFVPAGVATWERAVEIGPGSGKYTLKVLAASSAQIRAYDVSAEFLRVCEERCRTHIDSGRLSLHLLGADRADGLLLDVEEAGWAGEVDALFSIDAMVHVDLQYLVAYLIGAAAILRPGGRLVLTLANAVSPAGFEKLIREIHWTFPAQSSPIGSGKFEWLSPDIVRSLLPRLGFELDLFLKDQRDLHLVASLARPERGRELVPYLLPGGAGEHRATQDDQRDATQRVREAVERELDPDALVLVVSRGDDELLDLGGRTAWHFPRTPEGWWAGAYPADSTEAIDEVEALRDAGAGALLFPAASLWWLDHYVVLRHYLELLYPKAIETRECLAFDLSGASAAGAADGVVCPFCGAQRAEFEPYGSPPRPNAVCSGCRTLERHRLLWLYLHEQTPVRTDPTRLLHVSPEPSLESFLRSLRTVDYLSVDLSMPEADLQADLEQLPLDDAAFDLILCSHVLEHLDDDQRAMRELWRVLAPGGRALLLVPIDMARAATEDAPSIVDPSARERRFGQRDHVRRYGRDFVDRLRSAGFDVVADDYARRLPEPVARRFGLARSELVFVAVKGP
jgi:SAM-dependent methyltransferase